MDIGKTLYLKKRDQWRKWLLDNHEKEKDIWLIYYKKHTGKESIPYNDAVEEALCFGWIDSIVKRIDEDKNAQRYSPRKKNSFLSATNKERVRKLIKEGKMTDAGLSIIKEKYEEKFFMPKDILESIMQNKIAYTNFKKFPKSYIRIRIGWIDDSRKRPEEFKKRLEYFIKKTEKNKKFGMIQ
jgi:uncharacterized protein YdeI (YjbR/CyaY-like superfamily)